MVIQRTLTSCTLETDRLTLQSTDGGDGSCRVSVLRIFSPLHLVLGEPILLVTGALLSALYSFTA